MMKTILKLTAVIGDRDKTYSYQYEWKCAVPEGLTPIHEGLLQKGFGETLRDKFSTFAKVKNAEGLDVEAGHTDKDIFTRGKLDELKGGTYHFGAGGGGGTTLEDEAWIAFLNAIDRKEGGKIIIKKNLERAQRSLCRQDLIAEHDAGTPERQDVEANIGKHLAEKFADWKTKLETDPEEVGGHIVARKAIAAARLVSMKKRRH